jgi:nitrate/nitrite-specific signal transduction histidine kinase
MINPPSYKKLAFLYAVLQARFEIREYFLKTAVKDVYENIGQVLSFVQIQLSLMTPAFTNPIDETEMTQNLVAQSIKDLRLMCSQFYSDIDIMEHTKWLRGIEYTIKTLNLNGSQPIKVSGTENEISAELRILLFQIIQEILVSIKAHMYTYHLLRINQTPEQLVIDILYSGGNLPLNKIDIAIDTKVGIQPIRLKDKLELLGADLQIRSSKKGRSNIKLKVPINLPVYE